MEFRIYLLIEMYFRGANFLVYIIDIFQKTLHATRQIYQLSAFYVSAWTSEHVIKLFVEFIITVPWIHGSL